MKELRVGLIGCGFMGRAHANAHRKVWNFFDLKYRPVLKAICDFNGDKARSFAEKWGFESVETDYKKLVARKDIDLIDICLPNNLHAKVAIAAAKAPNWRRFMAERPHALIQASGLTEIDLARCADDFSGDLLSLCLAAQEQESTWVNFKLFGMMGLTLAFVVAQAFYLARHIRDTDQPAETD